MVGSVNYSAITSLICANEFWEHLMRIPYAGIVCWSISSGHPNFLWTGITMVLEGIGPILI